MPRRSVVFALPFALMLMGCPAVHQPPAARAQDAAREMNLNTRFGRMELAAEFVAPKARETFFERRQGWGGAIRIADYELSGLRMHGDEEADVFVKVAWFRMSEQELRTSTLKQTWQAIKGEWKLVEESRSGGDIGLLGEHVAEPSKDAPAPKPKQFPTIRLSGEARAQGTPSPL